MKAELVPVNGDSPIPITKDVTVIGRRDGCDIVIDHTPLSKRHCVLVRTDGLLIIRDLATTNGTKVNGQRVRWAALLPRDKISLAGYKMRVYLGSDDMQSPSERHAVDQLRHSGSADELFATPTPEDPEPDFEAGEDGPAAADFFDESSAEIEARVSSRIPRPPRAPSPPIAAEIVPVPPPSPEAKPSKDGGDRPFFIQVDET